MNPRVLRWLSIADVTLLPLFILWFIWRLQFTARWTWVIFAVWLLASFAAHRDTPKTLGWRADNLWPATQQAIFVFGGMAAGLVVVGLILRAYWPMLPALFRWRRIENYFAFCLLQQVALNSLLHNRMMTLVRNDWARGMFHRRHLRRDSLAESGTRSRNVCRWNRNGLDVRPPTKHYPANDWAGNPGYARGLGVSDGMAPSFARRARVLRNATLAELYAPPWARNYSLRRACIGSMDAARRAGK